MSDQKLRDALIRLAHAKPELRKDILPMLKTAKKPHFNLSNHAEQYEDEIAMLAAKNYGPWRSTAEAEALVKEAIKDYAQERYRDVIESFGKQDIKYIVEMHMYQDENDPYNLEPPDPKVGKDIESALKAIIGNDWSSYAGVRADKGMMYHGSNKAWQVYIEGHPNYNVANLWRTLGKALGRDFDIEVRDNVTLLVPIQK